MKKIISLVIAFMMLGTTAFANAADDFGEVWKEYSNLKSYTCKTAISFVVNEPLLFLEDIPLEDETIDIPLMISDLLKSTVSAEYQISMSDDYKKMQMAMSMAYDVPITLNEDLKIEAWTRNGTWLDYDMTSPDEPRYRVIQKSPLYSKYQVMDMPAEETSIVAEIITPQVIEAISDAAFEIIKNNGEITKIKNGYRVKFDNDGMLGYLADIFKVAKMFVPDEAVAAEFDALITAIEGAKGSFKIFGEDGLTLELTQNARGDIKTYIEAMHFDFNLYDLAVLMGLDTEGLLRERANVNITIKAQSEMSGHNSTVVTLPEITDENSENLFDEYDPIYEEYELYEPPYIYEYVYSDQMPYVDDGEVFLPVYDLFGTMFNGEFAITADSLRYTATGENEYGIGQVFVKVGENSVMVDDEYITFEKPVVNEFDIFRVPMEFVNKLGFELDYAWIDGDGTSYTLYMKNPNYVE